MIDIGDGKCSTVPIYEGCPIASAAGRNQIGGKAINNLLQQLLIKDGHQQFSASALNPTVNRIKEEICYVSLNSAAEMAKSREGGQIEKKYDLPDGTTINVNSPRFMAPECLFYPDLIRETDETHGIHKLVYKTILSLDIGIRNEMFQTIILTGGTSLFKGLPKRLKTEIEALCGRSNGIDVLAPADRQNSPWVGGSIMTSLSSFQNSWITKEEY